MAIASVTQASPTPASSHSSGAFESEAVSGTQFDLVSSHGPAPDEQMLEHANWLELAPSKQNAKSIWHHATGSVPVMRLPSRLLTRQETEMISARVQGRQSDCCAQFLQIDEQAKLWWERATDAIAASVAVTAVAIAVTGAAHVVRGEVCIVN